MRHRDLLTYRFIFLALVVTILSPMVIAEVLYVDDINGNDTNPGTKQKPVRTIGQVAVMVNNGTEGGPTTIKIGPGIYGLEEAVVFENKRAYTKKARLLIEATILPNDPNWRPAVMPVILSIEDPRERGRLNRHTETYGLKIKVSHVTICGLKFLGNPLPNNWHACIERTGEALDDLLLTQCMFVGDKDALNIYCPAIATGDRFVVDHCIFYNCHASAVFWDGLEGIGGKGCAMRYCIVEGGHISGVWTCQTAEDFEFEHNTVTGCEYFWLRKAGDEQRYRINDCVVSKNKYYSGYGTAAGASGQTGPEVTYDEKNVTKEGDVVTEKNKKARNYLHVVPGTFGYKLGAGLFKRNKSVGKRKY
ncbi:MAG: right-handed parallel beta-helix repeat-containing protein [Planctomycetota bacterium]|jgi:hypothetical protein